MQARLKRRITQGAAAAAALVVTVALIVIWGWRFGFSALPEPISGCQFEARPELSWSQVTTNHTWYWFRALQAAFIQERARAGRAGVRSAGAEWNRSGAWAQVVEGWARTGRISDDSQRGLGEWLERHPEVEECFRSALASTEPEVPSPLEASLPDRVLLMRHYPLVLAAGHEKAGRWGEALQALVDAWRFQARLPLPDEAGALFDERGLEQLNTLIARPWRRLALEAPALDGAEIRSLLDALSAVTNMLDSVEASYQRCLDRDSRRSVAPLRADWARVRLAYRVAGLRLRQEIGGLVAGLLERLLGGRRPAPLRAEGIRHLGRPLVETLAALQQAVARPADLDRVREARLSHALAELRRVGPYASSPQAPTAGAGGAAAPAPWPRWDQWSSWRRALDRPAVWRSAHVMPAPSALREQRDRWLVLVESCRLTLALRAFRDQHGRWPTGWAELVPEILPAIPIDPFSGQPFGYEWRDGAWAFWSVGVWGRRPSPAEAEQPPQRLFTSSDDG